MRIAVISMIKDPWGGSEELWAAMAEEALSSGNQVLLSALDTGEVSPKVKRLIDKGLKLKYRRGYIPSEFSLLKRMVKKAGNMALNKISNPFNAVLRWSPDIILYVGTAYSITNDAYLLSFQKNNSSAFYINCQLNFENARNLTADEVSTINKAYAMAKKVLFVSHRNLHTASRHLANPIINGKVVRNPVNMQDHGVIDFPESNQTIQFAMVGNLITVHKGQDLLLDTLHSQHWKERNWHLNIYGKGVDDLYLRNLVKFFNLETRVTFHGRIADIREIWKKNHLLVMPSLMEGMPLAVVEAMICGRPSVVTDVGGHTEWITEGEEGFVAEAASVHSISNAMERAWEHKNQWQQMGIKAHHKALSLYDPEPGKTLLRILTESTT